MKSLTVLMAYPDVSVPGCHSGEEQARPSVALSAAAARVPSVASRRREPGQLVIVLPRSLDFFDVLAAECRDIGTEPVDAEELVPSVHEERHSEQAVLVGG